MASSSAPGYPMDNSTPVVLNLGVFSFFFFGGKERFLVIPVLFAHEFGLFGDQSGSRYQVWYIVAGAEVGLSH